MFIVLFMYALTTLPLSKALLTYTQPLYLIGLRMTIAGSLLLAYYYFYHAMRKKIAKPHLTLFVHVLLFAILLPYFLRYWGFTHATSPRAELLFMSGPIITYLLTALLNVERLTFAKTVALCMGYCGLLISMKHALPTYIQGAFEIGEVAIVVSICSFAYGWYVIRRLVVEYDYAPTLIQGATMLPAGLCGLTLSYATEPMTITGDVTQFALALATIILVSNVITHTLYAALLKKYSLTFLQICSLTAPLFVHVRQVLAGTESWSLNKLVAAPLILGSIILFYFAERHKTSAPEANKGIFRNAN